MRITHGGPLDEGGALGEAGLCLLLAEERLRVELKGEEAKGSDWCKEALVALARPEQLQARLAVDLEARSP